MAEPTDLVDEGRSAPISWRGALACVLVFAATLAAGAALLDRGMPAYLENRDLRAKLLHFAEHRDRYDTLFIGSSRVYRQIDPEVFDAATARAGHPTASFNFGMGGMWGLETEFVLEEILALRPANLRWVWIEPGDPAHRSNAQNRASERFVAWHDLRGTWRALDLWLGGERPGYDGWTWSGEHLPAFGRHVFQIGRAVPRLRPPPVDPESLGPNADGFAPLRRGDRPDIAERRDAFLDDVEGFREQTEALGAELDRADRALEPFERRFLLRLRAHVEAAGARPLFLITPELNAHSAYLERAAGEGLIPVAFNYASPERHPELYAVELRFDHGHLNLEGARRFSLRLAQDFVRHTEPESRHKLAQLDARRPTRESADAQRAVGERSAGARARAVSEREARLKTGSR